MPKRGEATGDDGITYAKPLLWDASWWARQRARVFVTRLALRCAIRGHEWRQGRPTRCVTVTACRICGAYIGHQVDRSDPERECLWFKPSMVVEMAPVRLGSCCVNVGTDECACENPTNWGLKS